MDNANPIAPRCARCGSDKVVIDAVAEWCAESQQWELCGLMDQTWCEPCEDECDIEWCET